MALLLFAKKKNRAGVPVIEYLDEGFIEQETSSNGSGVYIKQDGIVSPVEVISVPQENYYGGGMDELTKNDSYITHVGVLPVTYSQPQMSGRRMKGVRQYTT